MRGRGEERQEREEEGMERTEMRGKNTGDRRGEERKEGK
jgi:hypothetical protein